MVWKDVQVFIGDNRETLKNIPDGSVYTCVTSPPYYGLRDYGTGEWVGGDPDCPHRRTTKTNPETNITGHKNADEMGGAGDDIYKSVCLQCGAVRVDKQIGLEETPQEYIDNLVQVFREVKRILRDDGTLWVNIGDSYAGSGKGQDRLKPYTHDMNLLHGIVPSEYKPKDLMGIPWRLAFALQQDGWYLRQDIIWEKKNSLPESVKDRCTKSHEYIFLLSKSEKYYFDYIAIREKSKTYGIDPRSDKGRFEYAGKGGVVEGEGREELVRDAQRSFVRVAPMRNKRSVWEVSTKSYQGHHFAVFPPDLIEPCVLAGCPKGGTVLDPFGGSGTTAGVAVKHGRKAIYCDLNEEFAELINQRIDSIVLGRNPKNNNEKSETLF